jgi:nucleotide-binding universal stress UspA family protein
MKEEPMLRTVSLALLASGESDNASTISYAMGMVERAGAHLSATIVVPPLLLPALSYSGSAIATQMLTIIEQENLSRREQADETAASLQSEAKKRRVSASVEIFSAAYDPPTPHLLRMVRVSDICILSAPQPETSQQREILIDLLFGAGVPLILTPPEWKRAHKVHKAVVAWDGSRVAARAVRDSLALLAEADAVEIISVHGEKDIDGEASAADLAQHLKRHCRAVSAHGLPVDVDGVAATLSAHARRSGADLLVMGAYGHSRLREFVLGGATRDRLAQVEIPTLMSH